jgi:hypothetical protein
MMRKVFPSIALLLVLATAAHAGWTPDVRLTHRRYEINPQVAARGDTVHVVWQQIAGAMHISYMRSIDGGNNWDSLINLEETSHEGARPDFSLFPGGMFVGWFDEDMTNFTTYIAYSYSSNGSVWSSPEHVLHNSLRFFDVGTAAYGDSIYAIYYAYMSDSTATHPLRFLNSSDGRAGVPKLQLGMLMSTPISST